MVEEPEGREILTCRVWTSNTIVDKYVFFINS